MIRIKTDRSWKRQLTIILKGYLRFRIYWFYCILLIAISVLTRIFFYQELSNFLKLAFYPGVGLLAILPMVILEVYNVFRNSCFKGEGDVWVFVDDNGFGRESDFVKTTYKWDQVDTIVEDQDAFRFSKKDEFYFAIDKFNLPEESMSALRDLFCRVPVILKVVD